MVGHLAVALIALVMIALIALMLMVRSWADKAYREEQEQIRKDTR